MTKIPHETESRYEVVHPLFDVPEEKLTGEHLGLMKMSRSARFALGSLRVYLLLMLLMLGWQMVHAAHYVSR